MRQEKAAYLSVYAVFYIVLPGAPKNMPSQKALVAEIQIF